MIDIISQFWPFMMAGIGVVYGLFKGSQAKVAKNEAAIQKTVAQQESRRAQALKAVQDELIESEKRFNEEVEKGVKDAKVNRDYFTK